MEQKLRLVQGSGQPPRAIRRSAERRRLTLPGQIVWKDARGTTRLAAVVTRDVSDTGVLVQSLEGPAIPLYRMVYFQIDRSVRMRDEVPASLRKANVLAAVLRVGPTSAATGAPEEYALRLLVEPARVASNVPAPRVTWTPAEQTKTA
jgi:hypothetical protein